MDELVVLSALIGRIYDATLDQSLWLGVLESAAEFVGGPAATLFSKDLANQTGQVFYEHGIDAAYKHSYFTQYIKLDPAAYCQLFAQVGDIISMQDFISYNELLETRFYKGWMQPQQFIDAANAVLQKSATSVAMFGVVRHERDGFVDEEMRRRMRLLTSHFRRAVLIGKVIDLKTAKSAFLADTLDGISASMFLVDATGRIAHANVAAETMLKAADVLHAEAGRVVVHDRQANQVLADTFATAGNGDAAVGIKGVAVPLTARDGERYIAHVLPLMSGARQEAIRNYGAVAALFIQKTTLDTPSSLEALAKAYRLTPTELRVLLAIVEVGGVPDVAEALGIAETTVRTHLQRAYHKTGTHRQADLVKLIATFSNPLLK
jgi:DNA-binding CsgD family transcriptional regulator/PAS domain-containing protein